MHAFSVYVYFWNKSQKTRIDAVIRIRNRNASTHTEVSLQQTSESNSYGISAGTATVTSVTIDEIAKTLGLRRNSRKLRELFDDVRGGIAGQHTCVHAVHLLLKAEYERIGATFDAEAVSSVLTVFWHAYAKIDRAVEVLGDKTRIDRLLNDAGARNRLADRLTNRPSVHRYLYRGSTGLVRTALDRCALCRTNFDPMAVIDLEAIARRVHEELGRPLLTLILRDPKSRNPSNRQKAGRDNSNISRLAA
jgi:hypothetical protein